MISFTDNTRATPNERIVPWLLEALGDHPRDRIVLINQTGTHRPNSRAELEDMLTPEIVANYERRRIITWSGTEPTGSLSQSIDSESFQLPRVSPKRRAQEMAQLSQMVVSTLTTTQQPDNNSVT